ncbi:MAG: methyltransferase domain-containing protein [Flavobacteriales bacterium]|nr:methyltransferase domain-containing protein [Flavobacteriales bacterium]
MKQVKDNFSKQSVGYSRFRPVYPKALYEDILSPVQNFDSCWDCATGNGQIAAIMAEHFNEVVGSDISQNQLQNAVQRPNIRYVNCRAEETPFQENSFDLITVGQAIHWFDFEAFNREVQRVSRPNGVIAIIGYGLMFANDAFDQQLFKFYNGTIGSYWDPERKHIDSHYASVPFPFKTIPLQREYSIDVKWNLAQLEGYLNTWSSVNRYIGQHAENPVETFIRSLRENGIWTEEETLEVHFPLFVKLGRVLK